MAPQKLAQVLKDRLSLCDDVPKGELLTAGAYMNVRVDMAELANRVNEQVARMGSSYGNTDLMASKRVMVEFSCPNTNKPLHLGHMRNDAIGESISAILKANGAEVLKVNLINNRGVHICKSMLAYQKFGNGETPEARHERVTNLSQVLCEIWPNGEEDQEHLHCARDAQEVGGGDPEVLRCGN